MFQRIRHYNLIELDGRFYRPRAYGDPQPDGTWDGWIVFFTLDGGSAIATERETTQATFQALSSWAAGLTPVYLEGALVRALQLAQPLSVIDQLEDAEYEALDEAERLETAARVERASATVDEVAAAESRADAERIRQERLAAESILATTEEVAATEAAELHEVAALEARAMAADAARRSRVAETKPVKRQRAKKK